MMKKKEQHVWTTVYTAVAALAGGPLLAAREDYTNWQHGGLYNANIAQNGYNKTDNAIVLYIIINTSWTPEARDVKM